MQLHCSDLRSTHTNVINTTTRNDLSNVVLSSGGLEAEVAFITSLGGGNPDLVVEMCLTVESIEVKRGKITQRCSYPVQFGILECGGKWGLEGDVTLCYLLGKRNVTKVTITE